MAKTPSSSWQLRARAEIERRRRGGGAASLWPSEYHNQLTGKVYRPHNEEERRFVYEDSPRYTYLKGGEGAGKSVAGIIKTLNRLRRGMSGIMVSPDFEHFKKSLWKEFTQWCPWEAVIERHRYRREPGFEPTRPFTLVFKNEIGGYSELLCGGIEESKVGAWEGPNVSFAHFDEARRHRGPGALKVLSGRGRISGPNGEPPQFYLTSTPRKHWLFDYYGPLQGDKDPHADFKANSFVATVTVEENKDNLDPAYLTERRQTLTAAEERIVIYAEWEDEDEAQKFVQIIWWDHCHESLPPLGPNEPVIIALDANKGSLDPSAIPDCFAMVVVSRHPADQKRVAVRYCGIWQPGPGELMDYAPVEQELRRLCQAFSVVEVCYDPTQLHYFTSQLRNEGLALFNEFGQQKPRLIADKQLYDLIIGRRIAHDGNPLLREHIDNANVKKAAEGMRLVKRTSSLKIDGAVALSMGASRALYYNIS